MLSALLMLCILQGAPPAPPVEPQGGGESEAQAWILFGSFRGGDFSSSIHAVRPDGRGEFQLSPHPGGRPACLDPRVARAQGRILFTRGAGGSHRTSLWSSSLEDFTERELVPDVMTRFRSGRAWPSGSSTDGRLVFVRESAGERALHLLLPEGDVRRLCGGEFPAWSPRDERIAFLAPFEGTPQVWCVGASGGEPRRLTEGGACGYPSWSPDGEQILFSRDVEGQADLYLLTLEDGSLRRLTHSPGISESQASLSPDGRWIAYCARPGDAPGGWERSVFVLPLDGGRARQVSASAHNDTSPTWMLWDRPPGSRD